jgi:hypothetical protein
LTAEALRSPSLTTGHALNTESAKLARRDFRFDRCGACWRPVDRRPGKHCARCRSSGEAAVIATTDSMAACPQKGQRC